MKKFQIILLLLISHLLNAQDIYYVAPENHPETPGDDLRGNGSYETPWATFQKGFVMARPGDTVYFRGGTYYSNGTNIINPVKYPYGLGYSGTAEKPITYLGYPHDVAAGNLPVLDCFHHCTTMPPNPYGDTYNAAISMHLVEYIKFKDLEIRNVFQCDSVINGAISASDCANLTFEHIIIHNVGQRGYWIQGGAWGEYTDDPPAPWESDTTRWINCDVYDLCDTFVTNIGNAADAWKTIHYKGNYVSWEGCRAWNYTDDGWDPSPINGATRVLKNCWGMAGDKYKNVDPYVDGVERNAFKLNGLREWASVSYSTVEMTNCIAAFSKHGFYELDYRLNGEYYNNTAYRNDIGFIGSRASADHPRTSTYKNNIAYGSTGLDPGLKEPYELALMGDAYVESHNTWDWIRTYPFFKMSDTVTVTDSDFIVIDPTAVFAQLTAKRGPGGSLPSISALSLAPGSDLIDAGTNVGLAYNGDAPDIGAFEFGIEPGTGNWYPSVSITSPSNGSIFSDTVAISIRADASDPDGSVSLVEFYYQETIKIGETSTYPYSISWENAPAGTHAIKAVVTDNQNAVATSAIVKVTVAPPITDPESGLLWPNPNHGIFTLFLPSPLESTNDLRVISLEGKVMYTGTMYEQEVQKNFDFSHFRPGLYLLLLSSGKSLLYNKFIKL